MHLPNPIAIDLLDFFRTGRFDCLRIGQTREHILHNFPDPDDHSADAPALRHAGIWRYGNIELHFGGEQLAMIFSDSIDALDGGHSLVIAPWILAQPDRLTLLEVMRALNGEHLDFAKKTRALGGEDVLVELTLSSGVVLQFDARDDDLVRDPNELRLGSFSLQAPRRS